MSRLKDRVAVITGAASGIGAATAELFAREGARVVIADLDQKKGSIIVEKIRGFGGQSIFVKTDVTKCSEVQNMIDTAIRNYGRIDILHNNAGISLTGTVLNTSEDVWDRVINTNLKSVFLCSKMAIPHMKRQGGGVIINTASNWGLVAQPNYVAYCASKGGVVMLTKAMAIDHARDNIRINALCPGYVDTPLLRGAVEELENPEKEIEEMGKLASPIEMAYGAVFLASDEASHAIGMCLVLDNGETARGGSVKDHLPQNQK